MLYDTLIRNALIIDGSNMPGYRADVAIREGRIERIGDLHDATATAQLLPHLLRGNGVSNTEGIQPFLLP